MLVVVLEAHFMRVFVRVSFIAVDMSVRHVFVIVTGMGMRMAGPRMLVLVVVRCIMPMFFTHTFISLSLARGVEPAVAT
jgi:hypothetical protein